MPAENSPVATSSLKGTSPPPAGMGHQQRLPFAWDEALVGPRRHHRQDEEATPRTESARRRAAPSLDRSGAVPNCDSVIVTLPRPDSAGALPRAKRMRKGVPKPVRPEAAPVATANRFEALSRTADPVEPTAPPTPLPHPAGRPSAARVSPTDRVPPIIVDTANLSHHALRALVYKVARDNYTLRYLRSTDASIQLRNKQDYASLLAILKEQVRACHTYTLSDDRLKKAVIRGLPASADPAEIMEDLARQGFPATRVAVMRTGDSPRACPPFFVLFPKSTDMGKAKLTLRVVSQCKVEITKFLPHGSKAGTMCFRCQGFGHASANCSRVARCVKCTGAHATSDCPRKDRNEGPATCCNCGGPHPANYRECPKRLQYAQSLQTQRAPSRPGRRIGPSRTVEPGQPWSAITKGPQQRDHFPALPRPSPALETPQAATQTARTPDHQPRSGAPPLPQRAERPADPTARRPYTIEDALGLYVVLAQHEAQIESCTSECQLAALLLTILQKRRTP